MATDTADHLGSPPDFLQRALQQVRGAQPVGVRKPRFGHAARPQYSWIRPPSRSFRRTSRVRRWTIWQLEEATSIEVVARDRLALVSSCRHVLDGTSSFPAFANDRVQPRCGAKQRNVGCDPLANALSFLRLHVE
jgi:hypothetical protein